MGDPDSLPSAVSLGESLRFCAAPPLPPAYPEAQKVLDYESLDLRPFYSGALVRCEDGKFHR